MELDLTQQFKELRGDIQSIHLRLDQHDQRFDAIDQRFDAIDQRFEAIDQRFDKMREVTDRLEDDLDYVKGLVRLTAEQMMAKNQRLDQMRDAMGGLGVQLESLMDMVRLVAERLGGQIDSHGDLEQRVTTLEKHRNQTDIRASASGRQGLGLGGTAARSTVGPRVPVGPPQRGVASSPVANSAT